METKLTVLNIEYVDDHIEQYIIEMSTEDGSAIGHHEDMFYFDTPEYRYFVNLDQVRKVYIERDKELEARVRAAAQAEQAEMTGSLASLLEQVKQSSNRKEKKPIEM